MNAEQTIATLKRLPTQYSVMLRAKHGVGKSSVVRQVAEEMGIGFHDVRLSQSEIGDIRGLPAPNEEERRVNYLKPEWWPREGSGILFFDEVNRASKDVLQAIFEICLDRRLDGEPLPEGWRVVAAINGSEEYDVSDLDPALLDRWLIIDFDPSNKEWLSWATKSGVSEQVIEFVRTNPELLDPPVGNLEPGQVYPSRRSWVACDETLKALGMYDAGRDEGLMVQVVKGWLGSTVAAMFQKFVSNEFSRLRASDILDKWDDVAERVEASCADIEVIAAHANSVMAELNKRRAKDLTAANKRAIAEFFMLLPADVCSSIWTELLKSPTTSRVVAAWRNDARLSQKLQDTFVGS